jgi:hypothetical protein
MSNTRSKSTGSSASPQPSFTLQNKSNLLTEHVRAVLDEVTLGLSTELVHVIVKDRRRSPGQWWFDPDAVMPRLFPGESLYGSGYYLDLDRFRQELPHADTSGWRDRPPPGSIAMIVLRVGKDGLHDQRLGWLTRLARHEFMHHFQRLQGRCTRTPGKYLSDPIEIEARAAEQTGDLPWQSP